MGDIRREVMGEWGGGGVIWGFHNWWWCWGSGRGKDEGLLAGGLEMWGGKGSV